MLSREMKFLVLWSLVLCGLAARCPPEEELAPSCICDDSNEGPMMICFHLTSPEELVHPIEVARAYNVIALGISNSTLLYLPGELFRNTKFQSIRFMHSQIMALSDSDVAFEGLEDTLDMLRILEGHFVASWDWHQLRNLRKLDILEVTGISLASVDEPFPPLESLSSLAVINADVSFLADDVFAHLPNLKILMMKTNALKELKRSMLPNPAYKLMFMDFRENLLETLPNDMFEGMPSLVDVELGGNRISTLHEAAFGWAVGHLDSLTLTGNPIKCDCRLLWIVGRKTPNSFHAKCSSPERLRGRDLTSLDAKSIWC